MMNWDLAGDDVGAAGSRLYAADRTDDLDKQVSDAVAEIRKIRAEAEAERNNPFSSLGPMLAGAAFAAGIIGTTVLVMWYRYRHKV